MEDRFLLWRLKAGSPQALERLYDKYSTPMHTLAMAFLRDRSVAEDIVHDSFVAFAQAARSPAGIANARAYLMTTVANRARDVIRARPRRPIALGGIEPPVEMDQLARLIEQEDLKRLAQVLPALPDEQLEAILLHLSGGLTFKALAAHQNVSISTVQGRYRYGLEKLRSLMNHEVNE
jgi:RNA polymerase sigma factor (sigma-70 family)